MKFSDVIGNSYAINRIRQMIDTDTLPHALLLHDYRECQSSHWQGLPCNIFIAPIAPMASRAVAVRHASSISRLITPTPIFLSLS